MTDSHQAVRTPGAVRELPAARAKLGDRGVDLRTQELRPAGIGLRQQMQRLRGDELPQRTFELRSGRIFLDAPIVRATHAAMASTLSECGRPDANTNAVDVLTYLVNEFRAGERTAPYSMVTGIGAPVVPAEMRDDEVLVNQWLADDLQVEHVIEGGYCPPLQISPDMWRR